MEAPGHNGAERERAERPRVERPGVERDGSERERAEPDVSERVGLGGGCHWCTEAVFQSLRGVDRVEQGWVRSDPPNEAWSEAVVVHFRPAEVPLHDLIGVHLATHASASAHALRPKYRSAVYTFGDDQRAEARRSLAAHAAADGARYVTEALRFRGFRLNDERYLDYYRTRPDAPFCRAHIGPKLRALRRTHGEHLAPEAGRP